MSDYQHNKVIRLLVTDEIIKMLGFSSVEDYCYHFEEYVKNTYPEMSRFVLKPNGEWHYDSKKTPYFETGFGETQYYIDLVLYSSYGEECGDWGNVSYLSEKEKEVFVPHFNKLGLGINPDDLRKVDYCWYNCSEPPDYYDIKTPDDDWSKLI